MAEERQLKLARLLQHVYRKLGDAEDKSRWWQQQSFLGMATAVAAALPCLFERLVVGANGFPAKPFVNIWRGLGAVGIRLRRW